MLIGNKIFVLQTGVANTASVLAAFRRIGLTAYAVDDVRRARFAKQLVVPGVGAFGPAVDNLKANGLYDIVLERLEQNLPTLLICLGMQLLCESSDESPASSGFGIVKARAERFSASVRVPQFGWNEVAVPEASRFVQPGYAYYANSYCLRKAPSGWLGTYSAYDGEFVASIERGHVLACQFHPELSGRWGLDLLVRWYSLTS